jgi:hypothetical protein
MPFGGELDSFAESPACSDAIGRDVDNGQACAIGIIGDTRVYYFRLIVDSCRDVRQGVVCGTHRYGRDRSAGRFRLLEVDSISGLEPGLVPRRNSLGWLPTHETVVFLPPHNLSA